MKIERCYVCFSKSPNNIIELGDIHCAFTTEEEAKNWCKNQNKEELVYTYDYEITAY